MKQNKVLCSAESYLGSTSLVACAYDDSVSIPKRKNLQIQIQMVNATI
jgi:hypothetical protein